MLKKIRSIFATMKKNRKGLDINKETYRGTLKQIMKVRGLRTISLNNYNAWKGATLDTDGIHSIKLDIMSGYLNIFGYDFTKKGNPVCSAVAIENASPELYSNVFSQVMDILNDEAKIPTKVKKNILVRVAR